MAGGFPLRKWTSNNPSVLDCIEMQFRSPVNSVSINDNIVYALGVTWNTTSDNFQFKLNKPPSINTSKRIVLSQIAQIFDPLGLLSPIIIKAKVFLQELWAIKLSWDEILPNSQLLNWQQILQSMAGVDVIKIPRWIGSNTTNPIEIHGFCDASQSAMAAVVYVKTLHPTREANTSILCSKTKVVPLKRMTIPRLELSAAIMLTKLIHHVQQVLNLSNSLCYLWTDSSIVHTWLSKHPSHWKDFVHNRVCFIQETLPQAIWRHVSGKDNPADCATRGLSASQLRDFHLWWTGPVWLSKKSSEWPNCFPTFDIVQHHLEERSSSNVTSLQTSKYQEHIWNLILRYSSFSQLLRITVLCKRVILRLKRVPKTSFKYAINPDEILEAQKFWIQRTQQNYFAREIKLLLTKADLPKSNPLNCLCPIINEQGLLRVRGRLENSTLEQTAKHPYIIPRQSALSTLIIQDAHKRTLHGSTQDTLSFIRNTYWILGGRAPVRSYILKCVKCARYRRTQAQQIMGQLPASRVNPSRAFLHSGVDYAGPYNLKSWKGKNARSFKVWIALFVCLSTSAIHLEIVTDYTTDAFVAAYKRFTARRGICASLTSDCGTNFKGAEQQLKHLFSETSSELQRLASIIANDGTKWIFNPPSAPHFGGKWEVGVKCLKYHLKRTTGTLNLTYEEMTTLLTKIEAILNSRPLCPLTDDPNDLDVLTPGHFLIGQPLTLVPEPNLIPIKTSRLSRWQRISQMLQNFWSKWSRAYLQRFQAIYKWKHRSTPIRIGTLVLIVDERYPPSKWPLGRVIETYPGPDNEIRVASIRTATSIIKRPIVKLCPLPVEAHEEENSSLASTKAGGNV
ncbi:uncharacterized protein LOC109861138 [Pseudomyrmex gracilis]|uniref:uncharacterized protein LOC109861138 n=1 Tax=Pseudomyrmex gracilis TaxID=219809 RepID=UPI000995D315|nr:uncharacterized protein LOC109861138 [Pseudomyrmex gracilis]